MRNDIRITPHFRLYEFEDTRAGGQVIVQPPLVGRLQALRADLCDRMGRDVPILITSGFRTFYTNSLVGGVPDSQHLYGAAADIVAERVSVGVLAAMARTRFPFVRAYPDDGHVHVDVRGLY